ncbi:MAG: DUF6471 domain-containing protein [Pseudomonadota bacterium]
MRRGLRPFVRQARRKKLARGKFTAVFLIQCLTAIGAESLIITV